MARKLKLVLARQDKATWKWEVFLFQVGTLKTGTAPSKEQAITDGKQWLKDWFAELKKVQLVVVPEAKAKASGNDLEDFQ